MRKESQRHWSRIKAPLLTITLTPSQTFYRILVVHDTKANRKANMRTNTHSGRWNPGHSRQWADKTWGQLCFWATRASALKKLEVKKTCERRVEQYRLWVAAPAKPSEMQKPDRRALPRSETENNHWPLPAEESATQNRNRDRAWTTYDRNEMRGREKLMRKISSWGRSLDARRKIDSWTKLGAAKTEANRSGPTKNNGKMKTSTGGDLFTCPKKMVRLGTTS
jgi:hypothetical protein